MLANKFLVGCDPEFVIAQPPEPLLLGGHLSEAGSVGYDHGGRVGELRPEACRGTYTLVKRLQHLLTTHDRLRRLEKHPWFSGAVYTYGAHHQSMGGHVHIGLDRQSLDAGTVKNMDGAMDEIVRLFERLDLFPTADCVRRRHIQGGYGRFGDVRTDFPDHHYEYRTMPSWLYSPEVAFLAITAAKLAAVSPKVVLEKLKRENGNPLEALFEAFASKDTNARRALEKLIPKRLRVRVDEDFKERWDRLLF